MPELLAALVRAGVLSQQEAETLRLISDPAAAQLAAESYLAAATGRGLTEQQQRLVTFLERHEFNPTAPEFGAFWQEEDRRLARDLIPAFERVASDASLLSITGGDDPQMWWRINEGVIDWTRTYYSNPDAEAVGSIPNLNATGRQLVGDAFSAWHRGDLNVTPGRGGLPVLIRELESAFGVERAKRIAVTEVTRIHAEAERTAALENPNIVYLRFLTSADEVVCPICAPHNGELVGKEEDGFRMRGGGYGFPPLHVNCRCRITAESEFTAQGIPEELQRPPQAPSMGNRNTEQP